MESEWNLLGGIFLHNRSVNMVERLSGGGLYLRVSPCSPPRPSPDGWSPPGYRFQAMRCTRRAHLCTASLWSPCGSLPSYVVRTRQDNAEKRAEWNQHYLKSFIDIVIALLLIITWSFLRTDGWYNTAKLIFEQNTDYIGRNSHSAFSHCTVRVAYSPPHTQFYYNFIIGRQFLAKFRGCLKNTNKEAWSLSSTGMCPPDHAQ